MLKCWEPSNKCILWLKPSYYYRLSFLYYSISLYFFLSSTKCSVSDNIWSSATATEVLLKVAFLKVVGIHIAYSVRGGGHIHVFVFTDHQSTQLANFKLWKYEYVLPHWLWVFFGYSGFLQQKKVDWVGWVTQSHSN